ncbi:MAG: PaaI family thioesterase [Pseudomonadales bacterium]|nr:PaaI family thioesterase [Pseudomonadales bacterium]
MSNIEIPEGFEKGSIAPFSNHIGPFYYKRAVSETGIQYGEVGIPLTDVHIGGNNRGHGGVLLTIFDEVMGMNAVLYRDGTPVVTVSLTTSFIAATKPGFFLRATATITDTTTSSAFVDAKAWCGETLVGSAHGVWRYLKTDYKIKT